MRMQIAERDDLPGQFARIKLFFERVCARTKLFLNNFCRLIVRVRIRQITANLGIERERQDRARRRAHPGLTQNWPKQLIWPSNT